MPKRMACADVGMDCDFEAMADSEEELMELVAEHAKRTHGIDEITPELKEKVEAAIKDV